MSCTAISNAKLEFYVAILQQLIQKIEMYYMF